MIERKNLKARNVNIDILKVFAIFIVCVTHVGTFLIRTENFTSYDDFIRGVCSVGVPMFMIISGYFFYLSSNVKRNIMTNVNLYIESGILFFIFVFILQLSYNLNDFSNDILLFGDGFGYAWFFKSLIIYKLLAYVFVKEKNQKLNIYVILLLVVIFTYSFHAGNIRRWNQIYSFIIGMLIGKYQNKLQIKNLSSISYLLSISLLLIILSLSVGQTYQAGNMYSIVISAIIVIMSLSKSNPKKIKQIKIASYTQYILIFSYLIFGFLKKSDKVLQFVSETHSNVLEVIISYIMGGIIIVLIAYGLSLLYLKIKGLLINSLKNLMNNY